MQHAGKIDCIGGRGVATHAAELLHAPDHLAALIDQLYDRVEQWNDLRRIGTGTPQVQQRDLSLARDVCQQIVERVGGA
ncbi:MAG: hypothetical protein C4289_07185 [Chloroflexota bacterium]